MNVAALVVFGDFLEKDKTYATYSSKHVTRNKGKRSKDRSLSFGHFETNKRSVNALKLKQNSVPKLQPVNELRSSFQEEKMYHRCSCPTLSSYNEDIYVPEGDSNLSKWFTNLHHGKMRHSNNHLMNLINIGK